jgi:hypothetical protein
MTLFQMQNMVFLISRIIETISTNVGTIYTIVEMFENTAIDLHINLFAIYG